MAKKKTSAMPDRSADVAMICAAHPESFPPGELNDPARLKLLVGTMVPTINAAHPEDGDNWGVLTKTDQGHKVPCDIIVWRPTMTTVDVMTGTGASWQVQGSVTNPAWVWTDVSGTAPGPTPPQPPSGTIPYDESRSIAFGTACNQAYAESGAAVDAGMIAVHAERDAWDFYVARMPDPACHTKHVSEFRAVYGLPPV